MNKTRVIFSDGNSEQSLVIVNTNDYPVVVQTWIDNGEGTPDVVVPFIVLPTTFRLEPKQIHTLRIFNLENEHLFSLNKESVYWLNVYEVPPVDFIEPHDIAEVNLVMNMQYKIFIRPKSFKNYPSDIEKFLSFKVIYKDNTWLFLCKNSSNYHVSFTNISFSPSSTKDENIEVEQQMDMMIPPLSEKYFTLTQSPTSTVGRVTFSYIDDIGAIHTKQLAVR